MVWIQYKLNNICDMLSITTEIHSDHSTMHNGSLRHSTGFIRRNAKLLFVKTFILILLYTKMCFIWVIKCLNYHIKWKDYCSRQINFWLCVTDINRSKGIFLRFKKKKKVCSAKLHLFENTVKQKYSEILLLK